MFTMQEIKTHYLFSEEEAETLRSLLPIAETNRGRMIDEFYDYRSQHPRNRDIPQGEISCFSGSN